MVSSDAWVHSCGLYVFPSMFTNAESGFLLDEFFHAEFPTGKSSAAF